VELSDEVKEDKIGGACRTHGRDEMFTTFKAENLKWCEHLGEQGANGMVY
jgi:hypothetical protein